MLGADILLLQPIFEFVFTFRCVEDERNETEDKKKRRNDSPLFSCWVMCVCMCVVFAAPLSAAAGQQTWLRQLLKRAAKHQRGGHYREITRVLSFSLIHCAPADCHNLFITYNVEKSMNDDEISAVSLIYLLCVMTGAIHLMFFFGRVIYTCLFCDKTDRLLQLFVTFVFYFDGGKFETCSQQQRRW